ncbi:hypothetical protein [Bifidobacterium sp. SO1]|uniref:hypothetical protein n=1 Tax=Bifidobacterium sp. SO1 TaxID=2809029 RepID=UPI001BDD557A|nr:hypothetical protein [Bifidobacterium sp. SO1]MBT1162879.1 hypothetical protein [Bifidobacterium sp. SO1]
MLDFNELEATATRNDDSIEIEVNDGLLHYRTSINLIEAQQLLEQVDRIVKHLDRNTEIELSSNRRIELWDDGYDRYGLRLAYPPSKLTCRITSGNLIRFADHLEVELEAD